jgi:hypothetical protein
MVFEGPCIVIQMTETRWYVAVPQVAQPDEYRVVSMPPGCREASPRAEVERPSSPDRLTPKGRRSFL